MAEEKDQKQAEDKSQAEAKENEAEKAEEQVKSSETEENKTEKTADNSNEKEKEPEDKKELKIDPNAIKPGMTVRVHQKIKDINAKGQEKERIQVFEGIVLAKRGKTLDNCRILVRKIASNHIGVEKIFPLALPSLVKIEPVKQAKVRRAKLYFLRNYRKRLKEKRFV